MTKPSEALAAAISYELVADEYYDSKRHPTCANFREASRMAFRRWFAHIPRRSRICEVGAGKSLVAEVLSKTNEDLSALTLTDESLSMLDYSRVWADHGVELRVASCFALPFPAGSFDILASSLGDPYNSMSLWTEAHRVLGPNGTCFFTTPSWEWASAFRNKSDPKSLHSSVFEIADGTEISLPSHIYPEDEQVVLIEAAGFTVSEVYHMLISDLAGQRLSPKLVVSRGLDANVVTGFVAKRRRVT